MRKILWPRFGNGGAEAGRFLEASVWPFSGIVMLCIAMWALSVANHAEEVASLMAVSALAFIVMIPLVRGAKSRFALGFLVFSQAVGTLFTALGGNPGGTVVSLAFLLYATHLLRAAVAWHRVPWAAETGYHAEA